MPTVTNSGAACAMLCATRTPDPGHGARDVTTSEPLRRAPAKPRSPLSNTRRRCRFLSIRRLAALSTPRLLALERQRSSISRCEASPPGINPDSSRAAFASPATASNTFYVPRSRVPAEASWLRQVTSARGRQRLREWSDHGMKDPLHCSKSPLGWILSGNAAEIFRVGTAAPDLRARLRVRYRR